MTFIIYTDQAGKPLTSEEVQGKLFKADEALYQHEKEHEERT